MKPLKDYEKVTEDGIEYTIINGLLYPNLENLEDIQPYKNLEQINPIMLPRWAKMKYNLMMIYHQSQVVELQKQNKLNKYLMQVQDEMDQFQDERELEVKKKLHDKSWIESYQAIQEVNRESEEMIIEMLSKNMNF